MLAAPVFAQTQLQISSPIVGTGTVTVTINLPSSSTLGGPTNVANLKVTDNSGNNIPITTSSATPAGTVGYFSFHTKTATKAHHYTITPLPLTIKATNTQQTLDSIAFTFSNTDIAIPKECPCGNKVPSHSPSGQLLTPPFSSTCASAQNPYGDASLSLPNGSNFAEATLNVSSPNNETVDISCVQGANSTINVLFIPNGSANWTNNRANNVTTSIQNSWVDVRTQQDNNCVYPNNNGVFAYGLTNCTTAMSTGTALGACPNYPSPQRIAYCNAEKTPETSNTCNIERAAGKSGGTVQILYMGEVVPPGLY
jgi:hypothetical protein